MGLAGNEAEGTHSQPDPNLNGFDHPDVDAMIRWAIAKVKRDYDKCKFSRYKDIDEESLFTDIKGEVWKSWKNYNPALRKPGSHAYQVAYRRLMDKNRTLKHRPHSAIQRRDGKEPGIQQSMEFEDREVELVTLLEGFYAITKEYWDKPGLEQGPIGPGRPSLTWPQKAALTMLQRKLGCSFRDMEGFTKRFPSLLTAIGVMQSKSYGFFFRSARSVTKFARKQKKILSLQTTLAQPA